MGPKRKLDAGSSEPKPSDASSSEPVTKKAKSSQPAWFKTTDEFVQAAKNQDGETLQPRLDEWVEKMALHLAHCPQFIEWGRCPTDPSQVQISFWWMTAVNLPGRWNKYKDPQSFYQSWWRKLGNQDRVLQRAEEILMGCLVGSTGTIDNVRSPLPSNSSEDRTRREALFRLHSTCHHLIAGIAVLTEAQHGLSRKLKQAVSGQVPVPATDDGERSEAYDDVVKELGLLENVKQDFKDKLATSVLDQVGIRILDDLLQSVPETGPRSLLYEISNQHLETIAPSAGPVLLSAFDRATKDTSSNEDNSTVSVADVRKMIEQKFNFVPDYLGESVTEEKLAGETLTVTSATKGASAEAAQKIEKLNKPRILDPKAMRDADELCAKWLETVAEKFNKDLFKLTFSAFEEVVERPSECVRANKGSVLWRWKPSLHLQVIKDNMWHVRSLVLDLREARLLREPDQDEDLDAQLQQTLRRMWALLSVNYGCYADVDLMLTVMDRLLENLASLFEGSVDPRMETISMQKAIQTITKSRTEGAKSTSRFIETPELLERYHRVRLTLSEIARFYRGAFVLAVSKVSATYHHTTKDQKQIWYESLLKLFDQCGHPNCREQIKIKRIGEAAPVKGKGKATAGKTGSADQGNDKERQGKQQWTVSIAIKDARIGFPDQRAHLSKNRPHAYPCLSTLLHSIRYNVALGVFFHYFTHLYHPECRPFRGKYGLLEDFTMATEEDESLEI